MTFKEIQTELEALQIPSLCFSEQYEALYNSVVNLKEGSIVVELGCFCGAGTYVMAKANPNIKIFAIDCFKEGFDAQPFSGNFAYNCFNANVLSKFHNVFLFKTTTEKAAKMFDKEIDFLYIDAAHDYESVKQDIKDWLPKVKSGCAIGFDDYHNEYFEVKKAVDELTGNMPVVLEVRNTIFKLKI